MFKKNLHNILSVTKFRKFFKKNWFEVVVIIFLFFICFRLNIITNKLEKATRYARNAEDYAAEASDYARRASNNADDAMYMAEEAKNAAEDIYYYCY